MPASHRSDSDAAFPETGEGVYTGRQSQLEVPEYSLWVALRTSEACLESLSEGSNPCAIQGITLMPKELQLALCILGGKKSSLTSSNGAA